MGLAAAELEEQGRAGVLNGSPAAYEALAVEMDEALVALAYARAARA